MKTGKTRRMVAGMAVAASVLAGSSLGAVAEGITLTYPVAAPNTQSGFTTDPAMDYAGNKSFAMGTAETLFVLDDDTKEVLPLLATSIEQTEDLVWTITIRDGVTMSNGKELTADVCKKALEYIFANNTRIGTMADVASIEADAQTLTIKTNHIVALMPRILSEPNVIIFDTEADDYSKGLIGTGPYILDSMDPEGNCELSKNDNYWQGTPAADKIITKANIGADAYTAALQTGELDWASVSDADLALFEDNPDYEVMYQNVGRAYYLYVNPNYTFTKDDALREALTYAVDREAILNGVYGGHGAVTRSIFPEWSEYYSEENLQPEYDQEKAKQILADAGYTDTDGDGILNAPDGENVKLNITCYDKNGFKTLSEVLQQLFRQIGIDSEIKVSDSVFDDLTAGEYNIGTYGYNTLTLGDCYNYLQPVFQTDASSNFTKFSNEQVDADLAEMSITSDSEKRAELAKDIQKYVYSTNERIYIMHIFNNTVKRKEVVNVPVLFGDDQSNMSVLWKITKE